MLFGGWEERGRGTRGRKETLECAFPTTQYTMNMNLDLILLFRTFVLILRTCAGTGFISSESVFGK